MHKLLLAATLAAVTPGCGLLSSVDIPDPRDIAEDMCALVFSEPERVTELERHLERDLSGFGPAEICEIADVILPFLAQAESATAGGAQALGVSAP